jgi:ABC-type phosphate transport system substrate-binding protein
MRSVAKVTTVLAAAAALALSAAGPAAADPTNPAFTPAAADHVAVGSDTTQDVMNSLSRLYNAANPGKPRLASYDAVGSATFTVTGCGSLARPNGSSAGVSALLAPANSTNCIDVARSSRGPRTGSGATFYAFGRDGVTWAKTATSNAPANLTTANLRAIYQCAATARNWTAFGGRAGTIVPTLPQAQSGTRAFFLAAIALTDAQVGSCVQSGTTAVFQENQGGILQGSANAIAPYSAANWSAQSRAVAPDQRQGAVLGNVNGTAPLASGSVNPAFSAAFSRTVFNAVKTSRTATFDPIFGGAGYFCTTAAQNEVARFGFGRLAATASGARPACGAKSTGI